MKFAISMNAFNYAVKLAAPFVASPTDIPELQCLKIEATGEMLNITAFNRSSWLRLKVAGADILKPGIALIPAKDLRNWLMAGANQLPVEVEIVGTTAHLKNGKATCKIEILDVLKYSDPSERASDSTRVVMRACDLVQGLQCVQFAIEKKDLLKSKTDVVLFDIDDRLNLMATDDKMIAVVQAKSTVSGPARAEMLHCSVLPMLMPLLESVGESDASVFVSSSDVVIETERYEFGARVREGRPFKWRQAIKIWDEASADKIEIPVKETLSAARQVMAADPDQFRIELDFSLTELKMFLPDGKAVGYVDLPGPGCAAKFGVSSERFIDSLTAIARQETPLTLEYIVAGRNRFVLLRSTELWKIMLSPLVDPLPEGAKS